MVPLSAVAALATQAATTTIPIVFGTGTDPVQIGLVASFNRPGGNLTGISTVNNELVAKQLGLLHKLLPGARRFALLVNPNNPTIGASIANLQAAALTIGVEIEIFNVNKITATSMRRLRRSCKSRPTRSWPAPTRYLPRSRASHHAWGAL